jgi:DNA polymerase-3 subunit delta
MAHPPSPALPVVLVLIATEPLLLADRLQALQAKALDVLPELNRDTVDLAEQGIAPLLEAAQTLPMMAARRFVHGSHLEKLATKDHEALLGYVRSPSPTTVLVLTGDRLDGRSKLAQALRTAGVLQVLEGPKAHALPQWILQRAQNAHLRMSQAAAHQLAELVGPQLGVLAMSLEKLHLHAGPDATIETEDVVRVMAHTRETSIFELTGAIGRRDWAKATTRLGQLLGDGEAPLYVLTMLVREIRLLLGAKQTQGSSQAIAAALGVRPFMAERLAQDAQRFALDELVDALKGAEACDVAIKSSKLRPSLHLEKLLIQLCVPA